MRSSLVRFLTKPLVALAVVAAVAGVLRLYHLGQPGSLVFDEVYYAKDACLYAGHTPKQCNLVSSGEKYWVISARTTRGETSWVHPQLGKWAIAAGEMGAGGNCSTVFKDRPCTTPFGWRISSAAAGTATAVITAAIAWLLFGSVVWTYVTGLLVAAENLNFVQSRVSLLDIFLAFWVVLAFLFLVLDRRWIERRTEAAHAEAALSPGPGAMAVDESQVPAPARPGVRVPSPIWRPWRFAAGIAFGAACATKWSGVQALVGAAVLVFCWEVVRRRRAGQARPIWNTVKLDLFGVVLAFVVVPIVVYLLAYIRFFILNGWHPSAFWDLQKSAEQFHSGLHYINSQGQNTHPYESKPWTWLLMFRPVSYYFQSPGSEILAMGNPLLMWGSILTLPAVGFAWVRDRDWRAGLILVAALAQYLPWFLVASRVEFFFYMTPVTPFLVLAAVYVLRDLAERRGVGLAGRPYLPVVIAYVVVYVAVFAFFYPVLTGWHLSYAAWHSRMWMRSWI